MCATVACCFTGDKGLLDTCSSKSFLREGLELGSLGRRAESSIGYDEGIAAFDRYNQAIPISGDGANLIPRACAGASSDRALNAIFVHHQNSLLRLECELGIERHQHDSAESNNRNLYKGCRRRVGRLPVYNRQDSGDCNEGNKVYSPEAFAPSLPVRSPNFAPPGRIFDSKSHASRMLGGVYGESAMTTIQRCGYCAATPAEFIAGGRRSKPRRHGIEAERDPPWK